MDAYAVTANALAALITVEFAVELIVPIHDHMHESRGWQGIEVAISPINQKAIGASMETNLLVQFYDLWDKQIDPLQQVDPRRITGFADRFRRKVESTQNGSLGTTDVWYFEVVDVWYPHDPTGNKTRFEAEVLGRGDNTALTQR